MNDLTPRRPRTLAEMGKAMDAMFGPGEVAAGVASYRPRPTDVIISPYGKCGTTWLQQIFHTLRTRGDMDFDDISRVVPWIETAGVLGLDLEAPQRGEPRGFKSHLPWGAAPRGARYIVAFRDPRDAFVSLYRFMEGWFFEPGAISIEDFAEMRLKGGPEGMDYWSHLVGWWSQRDNPDVLLLSYEHMNADPEGTIRAVAAFSGIALDDDLLALTLERSSFDFMLAHKDRFDDAMMRRASEERSGLPPGSDSAKVRKGGSGSGRAELPAPIVEALDAKWAEIVTPATGFSDYAAFTAALLGR
ncbi:sulfotransferase domain-containing protein [Phenylobacterium sp.]|uniref:sulfotransferase domain-containing protein n=1 Tax=Phenylobacterium sp. TaxID=1871053 RepID=UPI0025E86C57|nr:sulfotransferase domain-containing protein [Phenylobacterium sp.]